MTLAGSILSVLNSNWGLTGSLAGSLIVFSGTNWFDSDYLGKPQISVTHILESPIHYFKCDGGTLLAHASPKFAVNCWVPIPAGSKGTLEAQWVEDMRFEVSRIIIHKRSSVGGFSLITPQDEGIPLHELDETKRLLRYEVTLIGVIDKTRT